MAAPPLSNTFEGGSDGTTVTTGNSGGASGNAFNAVTIGLNCTCTFNTDPLAGDLACHMVMAATAAATHVDWTALGSLTSAVYARFYLLKTATPAGTWFYPMVFQNNAAARCCGVAITTANLLRFDNAAGTSVLTSTLAVPSNRWVRVETKVVASTTVGSIEYRLYLDADAAAGNYDETKVLTGQVLAANIDQALFGLTATATNMNGANWWFDNLAVSTVDWLGPAQSNIRFRPFRMPMAV